MADTVLETIGLTKSYGSLKAVNNFTIKLESNKIYGLLGRNGAGKTTFLDTISSRIFADSGEVKLFGQNAVENQELLPKLCYMPEKNLFITTMRVSEIIESAAGFYDSFDRKYANQLCIKFALDKKKKYKTLSRGYESILRIVIGLASRAAVTIFDEPVLGLDAAVRDLFYRELLEDYTTNPRTFIISTHLIEESADIFEEALIVKEGILVEHLPVEELKEKARYVSGKAAVVDEAVADLKVIYSEMVGSVKICAIYEQFTEEKLKKLSAYEIDISPIPVQKLFIYLTNTSKEGII
jgi:ABC-2 type transport system ATP-binding protein